MSVPSFWQPLSRSWYERAFTGKQTVLLESTLPSTEQHLSWLFVDPVQVLTLRDQNETDSFFCEIERCLAQGFHLAGFFHYEVGEGLLGLKANSSGDSRPIACLGAYRDPFVFDHATGQQSPYFLHEDATETGAPSYLDFAMLPEISPEDYAEKIAQIQHWIEAGDTYQVNFTTRLRSRFNGDPQSAYEHLRAEQPCSYAAVVRLDETCTVLSFSPELFFQVHPDRRICMKPMKGTAPRAGSPESDLQAATALQLDTKNRAEHVMIVDLLRNDLGRICKMGSVRTEGLFQVETYRTVHQMISTVRGELENGLTWQKIFTALFPSGSITGAPKLHTMELIQEIEGHTRGVYTGAIGHIAPDGSATFSVAIRTLLLESDLSQASTMQTSTLPKTMTATMGVGGGIVADSTAESEFQECLLKGSFLHRSGPELRLIETMLLRKGRIRWMEHHLKRLDSSARALGFRYDEVPILEALTSFSVSAKQNFSQRLRLTLNRGGNFEIETMPIDAWPRSLKLRLEPERVEAGDTSLRHKTTFRRRYDEALRSARRDGFQETFFRNEREELTEGCISNLVLSIKGRLLTPALSCGVLPGICRTRMLEEGFLQEAVLSLEDLLQADALLVCNSLRGLCPAASVEVNEKSYFYHPEAADRICTQIKSMLG